MCKFGKFLLKACGVLLGKLLFRVVEPFLKNHYDKMERKDTLKAPYEIDKFPKYSYDS